MTKTQTTAQQLSAANEKVADLEQAHAHAVRVRNGALAAKLQRDLVAAVAERDALAERA